MKNTLITFLILGSHLHAAEPQRYDLVADAVDGLPVALRGGPELDAAGTGVARRVDVGGSEQFGIHRRQSRNRPDWT